jgi:hypothetical protein
VSQKHVDRLIEIAQRLDELAEEIPELEALSEELGRLAEAWPMDRPQTPEWLAEIRQIVERRAAEVLYERYGATNNTSGNRYVTIDLPNPGYMYGQTITPPAFDPKSLRVSGI